MRLHAVDYLFFFQVVSDFLEKSIEVDTASAGEQSTITSRSLAQLVFVAALLKQLLHSLHSDLALVVGLLVFEKLIDADDLVFGEVRLHPSVLLHIEVGVHGVAFLGVTIAHS
jgi:hypothetical protein